MDIKNAKQLPQVYYGLHMAPGVAEYKEAGGEPYRILVNENAIKQMDSTFVGKPVYVHHVDEVDVDKIHEADGFVTDSFYNECDGKHWVKFIVVSDNGHKAIQNGWRLSNAYIPKEFGVGGLWHGVEYAKEVTRGEYEHLAIVQNPRYEESKILTPEQFKNYKAEKQSELKRFQNSKGEGTFMFWKKSKLENAADLENTVVTLPISKVDLTISQLVNEMDAIKNMHGYANGEHMVKCGDEEMSVNEMVSIYSKMKNDEKSAMEKAAAEKVEKKENEKEIELTAEEKAQAIKNFEALKNAGDKKEEAPKAILDLAARGKARYGSEHN